MDEIKLFNNVKTKYTNSFNAFVLYRWLFAFIIAAYYFLACDNKSSVPQFIQVYAIICIYNALLTTYILKYVNTGKRLKKFFAYIDCIFASMLVLQSGGVHSDIYFLYYFVIAFYGIFYDRRKTIFICAFSILTYTTVCFMHAFDNPDNFNFFKLLVKDILLAFSAIGISSINLEVKKYSELHKREFKLARTDKLTGLANRHYFDQKLEEEMAYVVSTGKPINILMFDLDNFKKFNDAYGHTWGDNLLALFSEILTQSIRSTDFPVRYGGEEFLLILRDLDIEQARMVGDRIRRQLEKQKIYIGEREYREKVTVSCGVSQFPTHASSIKKAIDYADKALYQAKKAGKNTVVIYDGAEEIQNGNEIYINT